MRADIPKRTLRLLTVAGALFCAPAFAAHGGGAGGGSHAGGGFSGGGGFHGGGSFHGGGGFHGSGGWNGGGFRAAPTVRAINGFHGTGAGAGMAPPAGVPPLHGNGMPGAFPRQGFGHGPSFGHGSNFNHGPHFFHGHDGHGHGSTVIVAGPIFWGPYPYDYYYPPPPPGYAAPSAPYMDGNGYWYYCPALSAYYPDVPECPGGWQLVQPQY